MNLNLTQTELKTSLLMGLRQQCQAWRFVAWITADEELWDVLQVQCSSGVPLFQGP